MDVHRSRFVPYPVHPITSVAFSRTSDETLPDGLRQPTLRLALGRDSGYIEIWNPRGGKWAQESVFQGDGAKSVDGLLWTREPDERDLEGQPVLGQYRLFSISSSPHVVEWDLARGQLKKRSTGNFSEVWCFAAQPRLPDSKGEQKSQDIVAGCGDGNVVLLSTGDDDVQFQRFLARVSGKKARCICITYQTRERIIAGFADGNLRLIDTRSGSILRTMGLGSSMPSAPKNKFAWKLKCLPNGDIVAGDSSGDVTFWDGRSYSLNQRIEGHDSDCIDIVASADGKTIFTGNLEGKVAVYHNTINPSGRRSWSRAHQRRIHANSEVKALAAYDGKDMSVVVSGGSDLVPTVIPLRQYGKENLRTLPHLPQLPPIASARHARLLVSWWDNCVSVWRISGQKDVEISLERATSRKLVAKFILNTHHNIRNVAITDDGKVLAAATDAEVKVFQLRRKPEADTLDIRSIKVPNVLSQSGVRLLQFSPDGKWLATVDPGDEVQIFRLAAVLDNPNRVHIIDKAVELERRQRPAASQSAFKNYEQTVNRLAFSSDGRVLITSDLSGHLDSWVLEGHEDPTAAPIDITNIDSKKEEYDDDDDSSDSSDDDDQLYIFYGQHWVDNPAGQLLPTLDSAPLVLTFRPSRYVEQANLVDDNPSVHSTRSNPHAHSHELPKGQHTVWIMTAQHQMYEIDVLEGRLSDWSRRNPSSVLPEDFTKLRDRVVGAVWDVSSQHEWLWLHGSNWMFMLDVGQDHGQFLSKKRRHSQADGDRMTPKKQKTSGAGSKTHQPERDGISGLIARYENGVSTDVDLDRQIKVEDADADDLDMDDDFRLMRPTSSDEAQAVGVVVSQAAPQNRKWWCTFKFRPILGVVALDDEIAADENRPVEVAVVERPVWDIQEAAKVRKIK